MKSSLILWMMQQERVRTWFRIMENYIYAEIWLSQCGYFCDILLVTCLCDCLCVKSESTRDTILSKKEHWECWRQMLRSIVIQPVVVQHLWTTVYGLNFAYLKLWLLFQVHLCTLCDQTAIHVYLCFLYVHVIVIINNVWNYIFI